MKEKKMCLKQKGRLNYLNYVHFQELKKHVETGEQEGKEIEESEKKLFWDYFLENWVLKLHIKSPCKYA